MIWYYILPLFIILLGALLVISLLYYRTLKEQEEFKHILPAYDYIGLPIYITDIETREVLYENKAAIEFMGDVRGRKCYYVVCGFDQECTDCVDARSLLDGGWYTLTKNRYNPRVDRYFDAYECLLDWQGKSARLCVLVDVTLENKLNEQNRQKDVMLNLQAAFIHSAKTMFGAMSKEGEIIFINKSMAETVGRTVEEIMGLGIACVHPPEAFDRVRYTIMPQLLAGEEWRGENSVITKEGRLIPVRQTSFPIMDECGEVIALATMIEDITEEKNKYCVSI